MIRRTILVMTLLFASVSLATCKDKKPAADEPSSEKSLEDEPVLTTEEQRALRLEAAIDADESITDENYQKEFVALKKEIEADL